MHADLGLAAQLAANGLIAGSLYALLGVSWGLIFATTKIFHFAHALTLAAATYGAVLLVERVELPLQRLACHAALGGEPIEHGVEGPVPHPEPVEERVVHVRDEHGHGGA